MAADTEEMEELEAEQVYLLMRKEYRISRNVRAQWYFNHLDQVIQVPKRQHLDDFQDELDVVSVIPVDPPLDWDSDTSHLYRYRVTPRTGVTFLARVYRLVFCLDLSPSVATVDTNSGVVLLDAVFPTLKRCLEGITRPFFVPGSELLYKPQLYITVIAHTPFFTTQTHQVLVQGWLLAEDNLDPFLSCVAGKLNDIEDKFADVTAMANDQLEAQRLESERLVGKLFEDEPGGGDGAAASAAVPMVSPDMGFINMLRYGILALQLLPENSSAGLLVVTDGAIGLPDATMFDSLLVQLRNNTVACSFLLLGSGCEPSAGLGSLPYTDLMRFLATATCGALLARVPAVPRNFDYSMNVYHRAFLSWGFQKSLEGLSLIRDGAGGGGPADPWPPEQLCGYVPDTPVELICKHQSAGQLNSSLESVLSCRLREGYNIRSVSVEEGSIQILLVLPWKYSIFIEYHLKSAWPTTGTSDRRVDFGLSIRASYDFLHDVMAPCAEQRARSPYRQAMFSKFWSHLQATRQSNQLLEHLHSFSCNPTLYTVPEVVRSGGPLFYLSETTGAPEPFSGDQAHQAFCSFWTPVCMLDINIWQKWMHAHRIGLLLEHDHPLPKHLYLPNTSGRYNPVQCRQATKAVTTMLAEVTDFALLDGHSYIKFLYDGEEGAPPTSFYMLRVNLAVRPPCMVVRLAFLGGTPGHRRNQIVRDLRERILALTFTEGQTALSVDPPIRKRARPLEKPDQPKAVAIDDGSSEPGQLSAGHYSGGRACAQEVSCCVLLKKPVEKFLIRYERVPRNFLSPVIQQAQTASRPRLRLPAYSNAVSSQNRTASSMFNTLSRYLHHRRWVWDMQDGRGPSMSMTAMGRVIATIIKTRLQEGFSFAHTSNGVMNLVLEMEMQHPLCRPAVGGAPQTHPFVVQYVLFPPHITAPVGSRDNLSMSEDEPAEVEMESTESDALAQIITECWIEPQSGQLVTNNEAQVHFNKLTYEQVASKFYELDRECISTLVTMEYLVVMCESAEPQSDGEPPPPPPAGTSPLPGAHPGQATIQQVPFCFELPRLLRRCQQAELLLSTLVQDLSELGLPVSPAEQERYDPDTANRELYRLLLETVAALHHRQVALTDRDFRLIPELVGERERPDHQPHTPFVSDPEGRLARWRCYVKAISPTHVMITLLPESFDDLKVLMSAAGADGCQYVPEDAEQSLQALFASDSRADSVADTAGSGSVPCIPPRSASLSTRLMGCGTAARTAAPPAPPAGRSRACSAGAAAKKTVTLVTTEDDEQPPPPPRRRSRHPSSPSKLQHGDSDPARCPHRSRSFPNSEAGQRRRGGGRSGRRRPAVLGALSLPLYVYDCSLRSLTQQLGRRARPGRPPDICRDGRLSLANTSASPTGRGDEPAEDPPHLVEHCNVLQLAHTRAFVVGVFRSLQSSRSVHPLDVQWAIDLCDEQPLEIDITDFLKTICGHIRDFTVRSCEQQRRRPGLGAEPEPRLPLSLLASHQPCDRLQKVHAEVRRKFAHILRSSFGAVPASPQVYFYLPPSVRTSLDDEAALPDDYPERVPSADNEAGTVQLKDIDGTDVWRDLQHPEEIFSVATKTSLLSNVDSESVGDMDERAVEVGDDREEENMPPLFLQLTCTTRTASNTYTRHIRDLPTCIGELTGDMNETDIPLESVQVTLDILCLTLPYQVDARISEHSKHQVRATSFCSDGLASAEVAELGACASDDDSDHESFNTSQLGAQVSNLSEFQLQAVTATKAEVQWLLTDEIAALLLDSFPPQLAVLTTVADHVRRSAGQIQSSRPRRGCVHKQTPLNFVFGPEKSMDKFMEEFRRLQVPGYKLAQLDNLYYLVHESSSCQTLCWSLVPPLGPLRHPARLTPPLDAPVFSGEQTVAVMRPCTPDALMAQAMLARSASVDLCQYAASLGSLSDADECTAEVHQRPAPRRLRRSMSHRPGGSAEPALSREDREVAALLVGPPAPPRRRPWSQAGEPAAGAAAPLETRRCRSALEVRPEEVTFTGAEQRPPAGPRSDTSSRLEENVHLTEEGYEGDGDNSDSEHDTGPDHERAEHILLPAFWLILRVSDEAVDTFFHCRYRREDICDNKAILDRVMARIQAICKKVNQMLLLQELELTRHCDNLLEAESSADIWQSDSGHTLTAGYSRTDVQSPNEDSRHYLEANMKFQPGHFCCPVTWRATFALHPRLRGSAHGCTLGLAYLRQVLETFAVTNRRNMFVFKDPKLGDVFYLRLQECCSGSAHPSGDSVSALSLDERLSGQPGRPSVTSLRDEPYRGRSTSVGERETGLRTDPEEGIQLLVHGITEPGPGIKEDLVRLLRNRLDERLLELFSKALLRNPQTKLAPEDVHFIQPPNTPPHHCLKFTLPPSASPYLSSVVGYLRNNLLQLLHQPKYTDSREENHFRDWGSGGGESDMFLYVPSEKHGGRGMACVSLSAVRPAGGGADQGAADTETLQWTPCQFEALTSTQLYDESTAGPPAVLLRFNIWEKGRANLAWLDPHLPSAIRYALWDRCMVCHVLPHSPLEGVPGGGGGGAGVARDLSGPLRAATAGPPPALRSLSLFESPVSRPAAESTPSIVLTSPVPESSRPLDDVPPSAMARFLDRRISSPLTQLQDAAAGVGHSTPRLWPAADPAPVPAVPLRPMYGDTLRQWLQFGSQLNVPNLKRHTVQLSNRYTVGAFVSGLVRLIQDECPSLNCHVCRAVDGGHVLCDAADINGDTCDGVIVVGHGHREDCVRLAAHRLSFSGQLGAPSAGDSSQCSSVPPSPGAASSALSFRSMAEMTSTPGGPPSTPLVRQKLAWATIIDRKVELYTYNWPKEKWEHLHVKCSDLCQWTNARCSLLHSIVAQKLGLFHHQPFTRRYDQSTGQTANVYQNQMSHITQLIRQRTPPAGQQQGAGAGGHRSAAGRTRVFTETLRDCRPGPLPPAGPTADAVLRHGQQLIDVYRANRKGDEQKKLYQQCQTPESLDKDSTMESFVRLLKGSGRLLHFCFSPLLFLPSWRWQTAVTRDQALPTARELAASRPRPRARHASETSCRSGGRPSPRLRRQAADERWHETLCSSLLDEYMQYLQTMGFLPLQYGLKGGRRPDAAEPPVCAYLHRVIIGGGGYLLFQIGVEEPFFYVKLYALEGLRVRLRGRATPVNPQTFQSYLTECDDIRAHTHLHSYMHDYHLRMMQQYVSGRPLMLRQGLHITSFLEDFYNYYPKGPTHARNFMATGSLTIEEQTSTSPDQLYNYLLTHEKRYKMRVLRMIPLFEDSGEGTTEDEFVLVQLSQREVCRSETPEQPIVYDLALVVSRDLADPTTDTRLRLKFYLLMTSRREIYPTMFIERRFENYRRVDTAPGVLSESGDAAPSETSGSSSHSEDILAISSSGSGFFSSYGTLKPESVHYLGYFSSHEQFMQSALVDEVERVRTRILEVVGRAKVHCRCDSLWQRLRDEEDKARCGPGGGLSCAEMAELLTLVCCQPLEGIDDRLRPLVQQPASWYSGLIRTLTHKYADCHRYYQSESGCQRFLVVILPAETSALIVLGVDSEAAHRTAQLHLVTREPTLGEPGPGRGSAATDQHLLHRLTEKFVDCCCYQMWASFIQ